MYNVFNDNDQPYKQGKKITILCFWFNFTVGRIHMYI